MFVGGIASGIDTEALITQLLALERRPVVQMQDRKNVLGLQRDAWRDINTRLNNLRDRMSALQSKALFQGRMAGSSNADVVTAAVTKMDVAEARYEIEVLQLAQAHRVHSFKFDDVEAALGFEGEVTINDVAITIDGADSLQAIAGKINAAEDAGVTATLIDGRLVVRSGVTGAENEIRFGGDIEILAGDSDPGSQPTGLGLVDEHGNVAHELTQAQDAQFLVEGVVVGRSSNVIDDLFDGVTFTLRGEGKAQVTVAKNVDGIVGAVRAFVDQYNSAQSFMAKSQEANQDPLKRGVLGSDTTLMRIRSQLRTGVMNTVPGADSRYNNLMSVGISIDRYGTMTLDESKLRAALEDDTGAVERLFGAKQDQDGFNGVVVRLENTFQGWLEKDRGLLAERQKMFGDQIKSIDRSIEQMERRLELREASLMRQMTAMESAMAKFQEQATWLEGQLQQLSALAGNNRRR